MTQEEIKVALKVACEEFVASKLNTIHKTVASNKEALDSESKSSAGDKHETGRAMLQLEMEKAGQQLSEVQKMKLVVEKIQTSLVSKAIGLGTVIRSEKGSYFLGISIGAITIAGESFFVISPNSPIGKLLLGKVVGEHFVFQGKETKIYEIF